MATHMRDEAWRSLQAVFQALPADAIVDIRKTGSPPAAGGGDLPEGVAMAVKIEITGPKGAGADLRTWAAPPAETGPGGAEPAKKTAKKPKGPPAKGAGQTDSAASDAGPAAAGDPARKADD